MKLVFSSSSGFSQIWWYPEKQSNILITSHPTAITTNLSILGSRYESFGQDLFRSVKSTHIRHFPFFFLTITTLDSHSGYWTGLMTPTSSNLYTSTFAASALSMDIFLTFCFLGFAPFATFKLCCARSWLTPWRSFADQANMSWFLCRKANNLSFFVLYQIRAHMHAFF